MDKIDIRDLRVGNWVRIIEPDNLAGATAKILSLSSLEGAYFTVTVDDSEFGYYIREVFCEDIEPIPITEEILEKNGFKYEEFPKFAVNEIAEKTNIAITYHSGSKTIFIGISKPNFNLTSSLVLYVHEMQNLLRDAMIENEITI